MNKKTQNKLVTAAKEVLATFCWKDESGCFYEEIYADYRDELDDGSLKKICEAENPQEHFRDWLDEAYLYSRWDCEDSVIKRVLEDETVARLVKRLDETEVREVIRDLFYVKLPEKHFLRQDVLVDIMVDTGDANYDYTLNTFNPHYDSCDNLINEEASLLWLARQQGYKKSVLKSAMQKYPVESKFLNSIHTELVNSSTHMNTLTFLVKMSLEEYFTLQDAIAREKHRNESYYLKERTGRGWITIDKDVICGLYDPWNGSGSVLEIALDKDVRLPIRCIESAKHDGCRGYSIRSIYGCGSGFWKEALKEIHPMKKAA